MSKFQESLIRTAAMRSRVPSDMRPLFDHLVNLAKHSHSNPLHAKRAGRELRKARRLATTGVAFPLQVEPFSDVLGSEGIMGYELPEMQERVGGPYELPLIAGCAPPRSVAGSAWNPAALGALEATRRAAGPRTPIQNLLAARQRQLRARSALAGVSYALECAGYDAAHKALVSYAGAMIAGWPAGSEWIEVGRAGSDRLTPGEELRTGEQLVSQNGIYNLILQKDQNLVLYKDRGRTPLWASNTVNRGGVRAVMQADGNFVLYTAANQPVWDSGSHHHPGGAFVTLQNDGNLVVYLGKRPLWDSSTQGGRKAPAKSSGGFFSSIAKAVTSVTAPITKTVTAAAQTLVDGVKKYNPVALAKVAAIKAKALAGDIANSVVFKTLSAVANAALKPALTVIKAVGPVLPYVQAVVSFVPGVGTGVSAALGAAQALADGRRIDEAIVSAAKSAIPGGPLAQMGFDAAWGLAHGRPIESVALEALRNRLPNDLAKKAFDTGLALATAKTAQDRRAALGTAALGAIASNVKLPDSITNIASQVERAAAPAVAAVQTAQRAVQTAQHAVSTANAVRNMVATRNIANAAILAAKRRALAHA